MGEVWFAPDDPSLPLPWKGIVDGNTGCLYYWNPETNITQYEKPAYLVSSPSLSPSCSPGLFHPPLPTASDYNIHSQYPNLYPHYQAPAETVINGYTFPTQFPFPNHTHTPPNQPINPQSQFTDYHYRSLTHPPIAHPSYHLPPFATSAYPSEPSDQPFSCDPYSTSPHNSSYSPITYPHTEPKESIVHPYQLPYTGDLIPPSALAYTAGGTSCTEKDDVSPPEMKKPLRHNLKMRSHVMMKRKPRSQFPRRRRIQNNGNSEGDLCKASLLMAVNWDSTILSNKSLDSISEMTILDLVVKNGSISTSSRDAPMFFPGDDVDAVYDQLLGSDGLYQTERAKVILLLEGFRQILDAKGGPLVDRELSSIDMELARSYLNLHLEMPLMDSGNIPETNVQGAILNHFYQVTNLISGLKPNLLSTSFVESPVILEVSIPESYELGSKHEAVEFDKLMERSFTVIKLIKTPSVAHLAHLRATLPNWQVRLNTVLSSNKGGFDYDMNLENWIESLRSNSQQLFVNKHGKRIESKCSAMYHWLPSSLNWNKKCISVAFLSLELFVSSVTSKSLLFESCRGRGMSMGNAMEETLLENIALQIVIATSCANLKQLSYPVHLVEELATETVSRTLSTAIDLQLFKAIIVHALQLGLSFWVVVLHFIAVLKKLLVIGINSNGLITVFVEDFSNKMFLICCLLTTAESRTFFGRFRSLKRNKYDGRLNLHVQCISRMQLWHMGISCIIDTNGKQLENSPFCEQLKKQYGVFCFVILVEGYMMTFLLYFEDHIFQIWLNMRSKIGACTIIELSQRMNKMQIFPLDNTSWKLVVLKHVKSGLQINMFSYYVQRVVTLGIIHFGCGFFPFLYECVDYSSTIVENPTVIIRGAKDGNLLHWKMATGTLGHLNLHAHLGFDDAAAAHNALECLTGLLRHDTEVYFRYFLGIAEIYVAWKKTKFLPVFYINLSNPILDEDLEYIMKTLVSTNSTTLQSTTWNVISIFHGSHCQVFSMSLFEMTPKPFYTATVTTKVRPDEPTLLKVSSATFGVANIALEHHNPSLEEADALLNSNSMVIPLRCCSAYFIVRKRVTFGRIHTANSLGILQTGQEEYNVQSYMKKVNAHKLLILNPSDVVVKMGLRTLLSTYFKLIFALVLAKKIVDAADMIEEVRGTITVHDAIPFIMLTTGSCGYWNAKKAKAKSLHAIMWGTWFSLQRILLMKALQMLLFTQRLLGYNWRTFGSISNLLNSKA